jgi:serine/threonine-protein kinase
MKNIGKYKILEEIGHGGMGVVYRAHDPFIERDVAIKVISEHVLHLSEIRERFYREARSAGKLSHENITIVHDVGEIDRKPFIVMEYLKGRDLRSIIDSKESLSLAQKLDYAVQICNGLQFAHSKKIVHRDIKPENIKVLENGKVKIMDFGIAKPEASTMTQTGMKIGTLYYMSPEQIKGIPVDKRSDIFSFGVVLYELLAYKKPFEGSASAVMYQIVHEEPEKITLPESDLVDEVQAVVSTCLKKNMEDRYSDCSEITRDLEAIVEKARQTQQVEVLLAEGRELFEQQELTEAKAKFNEILKFDPNHTEAKAFKQQCLEREQQLEKIRALIEKSRIYFQKGHYDDALKVLEDLSSIDSKNREAQELIQEIERGKRIDGVLGEGKDLLNNEKYEDAIKKFNQVLEIDSQHALAKDLIAQAKRLIEQREQKLAQLAEVASLVATGKSFMDNNDYRNAVSRFKAALELDPNNREVQELIAECQRTEEQAQRIEKLKRIGKGHFENGKYEQALKTFKEIVALDPTDQESNNFIEKIHKRTEQLELVKRLVSEADSHLKSQNFRKAIEAYNAVLKLEPEHKKASAELKKLEKRLQSLTQTIEQPLVTAPEVSAKPFSKALWLSLVVIVAGIIVGTWFILNKSNQTGEVDFSELAGAAKQDMLDLKLEAQRVDAQNWAEQSYELAVQAEQRGDKEFVQGQYENARQAYVEARDYFRKSAEDAKLKVNRADLERLKDTVVQVKQAMLNQKSFAESVGAKTKASELYENALAKEREGDASLTKGDRSSLLAAQSAYADASDGYKKAAEHVELTASTREDVKLKETAKLRNTAGAERRAMISIKQQVPGNVVDKRDNPKYQRAQRLESDGEEQFRAGDFRSAIGSYRRAKDLYLEAKKEITSTLISEVDAVKESMLGAKVKIAQDSRLDDQYNKALKYEQEGDGAYNENDCEIALQRYKAAQQLYAAVLRDAEEQVATEPDTKERAQQEIQGLINKYRQGLENRDIQALKSLMSLTKKQERGWQDFFKIAKDIKVNIEIKNLQINGNNAVVDLFIILSYYNTSNNRQETRDFPMGLILAAVNGNWKIISRK